LLHCTCLAVELNGLSTCIGATEWIMFISCMHPPAQVLWLGLGWSTSLYVSFFFFWKNWRGRSPYRNLLKIKQTVQNKREILYVCFEMSAKWVYQPGPKKIYYHNSMHVRLMKGSSN
jgi:hypothetical protein